MTIIKTNIANLGEDKKALYRLTHNAGISVKEIKTGTTLKVDGFLVWRENVSDTGKTCDFIAIITDIGVVKSISPSFIQAFIDIDTFMDGDDYSITITRRETLGGRTYIGCELA